MKKNVFLQILVSLVLLFMVSGVVYASGSFNSTYDITNGFARTGTLNSRNIVTNTNSRRVNVTISPTRSNAGSINIRLQRRNAVGVWVGQGDSQSFHLTQTSTRNFTGGNSGTHRLHMWNGLPTSEARNSGNISISW